MDATEQELGRIANALESLAENVEEIKELLVNEKLYVRGDIHAMTEDA